MISGFLNAKFASLDDLNRIDSVVGDLEAARKQLKESASGAPSGYGQQARQLISQVSEILSHADTTQRLAELDALAEQYGSLDFFSDVRQQLVKKLELQELNNVQQNTAAIRRKLADLKTDVTDENDFDASIEKLRDLVAGLDECAASEVSDAVKPELDRHVAELSELVSAKVAPLKQFATMKLSETIAKEKFWKNTHTVSAATSKLVAQSMHSLLVCQSVDPLAREATYPRTLWAFDILGQDFKNRFVYHFEGKSETNRLDKPEWCLDYLETYLEQNLKTVTFLLSNCLKATAYESESFAYLLMTSLFVPVRDKLAVDLSVIASHKKNLSHLVYELQQFDQRIKTVYLFKPPFAYHWLGLTGDLILFNEKVFETWINNEKDFVSDRYDEIVSAQDAFVIDRDAVEPNRTKPTKSALNLKTLVEGITKTYENLALKHQLKFLSEVQLKLLNFYFEKLQNGRDAFETRFLKERQVEGQISPLERVCRIWCSLKFTVESMTAWGEELTFIQLWNSVNSKKKKSQLSNSSGMSAARSVIMEMALSISANLGTTTPPSEDDDDILSQTFFDSIIKHYNHVLSQVGKDLVTLFDREVNNSMREYFAINTWATLQSTREPASPELSKTIHTLSRDLEFVKGCFCTSDYLFVLSHVARVLANYIDSNIIRVGRFNRAGGEQLKNDVVYLWRQIGLPEVLEYKKLLQAATVLADSSGSRSASEYKSRLRLDLLETRYIDEILLRKTK